MNNQLKAVREAQAKQYLQYLRRDQQRIVKELESNVTEIEDVKAELGKRKR